MPLANKNSDTRRTSDFQGVQRAQVAKIAGSKIKQDSKKSKKADLKAPTSAGDIAAVLRALRKQR